jgi:N-glycosylase/DNA lyase
MTIIFTILLITWTAATLLAVRRVYQPIPVPVDRRLRKGEISW